MVAIMMCIEVVTVGHQQPGFHLGGGVLSCVVYGSWQRFLSSVASRYKSSSWITMGHTSSDGANQVDAAVPGGRTSKPLKPVWEVPRVRWIRNQADDQRVPVLKDQIVPVYSLSCVEKKMACCCGFPKPIRGMVSSRRGEHGQTPMNCSSISINCVSIGIKSAHRSVVRQKRWVKFLYAWKLRNHCCQKKGGQSPSSVKQLSADVGQRIARSPECDFNPTGSAVPVFKITLETQE